MLDWQEKSWKNFTTINPGKHRKTDNGRIAIAFSSQLKITGKAASPYKNNFKHWQDLYPDYSTGIRFMWHVSWNLRSDKNLILRPNWPKDRIGLKNNVFKITSRSSCIRTDVLASQTKCIACNCDASLSLHWLPCPSQTIRSASRCISTQGGMLDPHIIIIITLAPMHFMTCLVCTALDMTRLNATHPFNT